MDQQLSRRDALAIATSSLATVSLGCTPAPPSAPPLAPDPDYSLHGGIQNLRVPEVITVIGCGGFGAWPALLAALCGVKTLHLIDMADVDKLDLARAPFAPQDVGKPKTEALRNVIAVLRPTATVSPLKRKVTATDLDLLKGHVFDGTNDMALATELPRLLRQRSQPYITGFYSGNSVGIANDYIQGLKVESGSSTPVWIGSAALSGVLGLMAAFVQPFTFVGDPVSLNLTPEAAQKAVAGILEAAK